MVDTYQLQDMEIVVFERLFAGSVTDSTLESDVPIAVHEDINDTDQTIKIPVIPFSSMCSISRPESALCSTGSASWHRNRLLAHRIFYICIAHCLSQICRMKKALDSKSAHKYYVI